MNSQHSQQLRFPLLLELINISPAESVSFWEFHSRHHEPHIRNRMNSSLDVQVGTCLHLDVSTTVHLPGNSSHINTCTVIWPSVPFTGCSVQTRDWSTAFTQVRCKSSRGDSLDGLNPVCEDRDGDLSAVWDVNAERQPSSSRWRPPRWIVSPGLSCDSKMWVDYLQFYRIWHTPAHRWV